MDVHTNGRLCTNYPLYTILVNESFDLGRHCLSTGYCSVVWKDVCDLTRSLRSLRNTLRPVNRLPPEIISYVSQYILRGGARSARPCMLVLARFHHHDAQQFDPNIEQSDRAGRVEPRTRQGSPSCSGWKQGLEPSCRSLHSFGSRHSGAHVDRSPPLLFDPKPQDSYRAHPA